MTLRAVFLVSLALASTFSVVRSASEAATFTCREEKGGDTDGHYDEDRARELGLPLDRQYCRVVLMSGSIVPEDVNAFREWLVREPYTHIVKISSPGGSIEAAVEIGRLIRSRFMAVWTYNLVPKEDSDCSVTRARKVQRQLGLPVDDASIKDRQAVCRRNTDCRVGDRCCLSACVLVLAGGAFRDARNIGLHRPSLRDLLQRSYEDARKTLLRGQVLVEQYLKEMEVSDSVFTTMMQVPPEEIRLLDWISASALFAGPEADRKIIEERYERADFGFAPSIYDWLKPKCSKTDHWELESCLRNELNTESIKRAKRLGP